MDAFHKDFGCNLIFWQKFSFLLGIEQISKASVAVSKLILFGGCFHGADFTTLTNCHWAYIKRRVS